MMNVSGLFEVNLHNYTISEVASMSTLLQQNTHKNRYE